ncbi:MAG: RNA pseudouridine synthase [Beijerinckiaceae bacterium]|nr:RNA pseudouridine synthase [Beijerinckiaceae bacterium]
MTSRDLLDRILYRDADCLVLDKPSGLAVHRGPKGGQTLDDFLPDLRLDGPILPQLAHRLDRETTGCLVLGRNAAALRQLGQAFAQGRVTKTYLALACGMPAETAGVIDLPLARRSHDRRSWWMKVDPSGQPSETRWRRLATRDGLSWLALQPVTGRTHQLRVHCAAMGWPLAGDRVYGGDRAMAASPSLLLHAWRIRLPRPGHKAPRQNSPALDPLQVTAPLPASMATFLAALDFDQSVLETLPDIL